MTRILKLAIPFLNCATSSTTFSQMQNLILTKEQNTKWLDSLKTSPLDLQLIAIKCRLLADTNVFVRQFYNDRLKVDDQVDNRVYGDGKPTLVIGGRPMIIDNKTATNKILGLTNLLTQAHIKQINILTDRDPATSAIYGSPGLNGIIVMTVTKRKYLRMFHRLKLYPNY